MSQGYNDFFKKKRNGGNQKPSAQAPRKKSTPKVESAEDYFRAALKIESASKSKKKVSFPIAPLFVGILLLAIGAVGYLYPKEIENVLSRIEITAGVSAKAQSTPQAAKAAGTDGVNKANSAASTENKDPKEMPVCSQPTNEELSHFNKLNERKKELDQRESELTALEEELHKQKKEIEARIEKLEGLREEVAGILKERVEVDQVRVDKLVEFYSNMKPKQAAEIFSKLNEDLAVEVLGKMKKKNAADIMNLLEPGKARALSEKFTGYKRR